MTDDSITPFTLAAIGANIRAARLAAGLTLAALAKAIMVTEDELREFEEGTGPATSVMDIVAHVAPLTGVSFSHLLCTTPWACTHDDPHLEWGLETIRRIKAAERLLARWE